MKRIIYIILIIILAGVVSIVIKNNRNDIVNNKKENSTAEFITYQNSINSPSFTYPLSWGEVRIKEGNTVCPEEDTYRTQDTLQVFDWEYTFDEIKLPDSESFIHIGIRQYELDPENLNACGDDFHLKIARKEIMPEILSSVLLNSITLKNGLSGTYNRNASRLNTEARTQYTFFNIQNSKIYIIQPYISFIPYFDSPELKEIEQDFNSDIDEYIKKGETAQNIKKYLDEFTQMIGSINFSAE